MLLERRQFSISSRVFASLRKLRPPPPSEIAGQADALGDQAPGAPRVPGRRHPPLTGGSFGEDPPPSTPPAREVAAAEDSAAVPQGDADGLVCLPVRQLFLVQ
mmetsp:Transcript_91429/g.153181  ORF Transcript_91429/g.153181 Transcript_91429/m.153181 type:complete len:103 (+) Transcript_91429:1016-1324(+)